MLTFSSVGPSLVLANIRHAPLRSLESSTEPSSRDFTLYDNTPPRPPAVLPTDKLSSQPFRHADEFSHTSTPSTA
jgi:hypothetical protein